VADNTPTAVPFDIEKPACFYLGREYDLSTRAVQPEKYIMYDARDLTTHGVIVGMTGSGKTGLAITILEEAAIDRIPCILIDPKGDLTNLLLQFPDLDPAAISHWLNEQDARQKNLSLREYAEQLAARWRQGLEETFQKPERIRFVKEEAAWRIYTPGSEAGLSLSILGSFTAPQGNLPREALTEKAEATASALLGLTGIAGETMQSREHILIAHLLLHAWEQKHNLDLANLILAIQDPPMRTMGAYNLETFFPAKERQRFASTLNNVLAAPGFRTWTTGEPLDLSNMLYRGGKPQQLIFYVAHLDDRQRMFFTTLLLEEVLSWTRKQPGTTDLRALVYFDEVFGYLPPHPANPPSKKPLLTLLKQARAFGVGVLLATQNPVDLDYKALSNAGTWFIGKLQTERDKMRLLDGLESVASEQGSGTNRAHLETVIASLSNRVFLMHDIHRPEPLVFQTRWALSLLRGPLSREQITELMKDLKQQQQMPPRAIPLCRRCQAALDGPEVTDRCPQCGEPIWKRGSAVALDQQFRAALPRANAPLATLVSPDGQTTASVSVAEGLPPVLPHDVTQFYLPPSNPAVGGALAYEPHLLGFAEIVFLIDKKKGKESRQIVHLLAKPNEPGHPVDWSAARTIADRMEAHPRPNARWANVSASVDTGRKLKALEKAFIDYLYSTHKLSLLQNRTLELVSEPGESAEAFRQRCHAAAVEEARQAIDMTKVKFQPKFEALGLELPNDPAAPKGNGSFWDWLVSFAVPKPPTGPPATRQEEKERKLTGDYLAKIAEIHEKWKRIGEEATTIEVKPRKADVRVTHFGLAWVPQPR
jgi:hypothetical protein